MKLNGHHVILGIVFIVALALGVGTFVAIEEARPLRNEYSFDVRSVANPPENVIFPYRSIIDVVATVDGNEVARTTVHEHISCGILPREEFVFDSSVSEVLCSLEGSAHVFSMRETDYDTTVVERYELTDATVESPGPESYAFVETVFGGNNDASSNP